jgi:transposase-like protein
MWIRTHPIQPMYELSSRKGLCRNEFAYANVSSSNNVIEQDHRTVKKRIWLAKGYNTFQSAWRTIKGIETMNMIRKGRVRCVAKKDVVAEARFVAKLSGLAA